MEIKDRVISIRLIYVIIAIVAIIGIVNLVQNTSNSGIISSTQEDTSLNQIEVADDNFRNVNVISRGSDELRTVENNNAEIVAENTTVENEEQPAKVEDNKEESEQKEEKVEDKQEDNKTEETTKQEKSSEQKVEDAKKEETKKEDTSKKSEATKTTETAKKTETTKKETVETSVSVKNVKISVNMDLTKRTGLSRENFIKLIAGVKADTSGFFEKNAGTIYDICKEYSINEIFFCGLISAESGWNIASNHRRTYNYISMMRGGKLIQFSSVENGLREAAKLLHNKYLTPGGSFYRGKTLQGVQKNFCPSGSWISLVYGRMKQVLK